MGGNLLQLHLLALRIPNIERDRSVHNLMCIQAQSSQNQRTPKTLASSERHQSGSFRNAT
jgi:hypothetical protein